MPHSSKRHEAVHGSAVYPAAGDGWERPRDGGFYRLQGLDLLVPLRHRLGGVYIAAFGESALAALAVGHAADIGAAIAELAVRPEVLDFRRYGELFVTWRIAERAQRSGMVRFLHQRLHPILDQTCPTAPPRVVAVPPEFSGRAFPQKERKPVDDPFEIAPGHRVA
jgi:hypothetical protein